MSNSDDSLVFVSEADQSAYIEQLKKVEWKYWLNRPYSIFLATLLWDGCQKKFFERAGLKGFSPNNQFYQFPDLYYDAKFNERGLAFFAEYFKTHKVSDLSVILDKTHEHHINELKKIITDTKSSIPKRIERAADLCKDYLFYLNIINILEEHFNKRANLEVPKYIEGDYTKFVGDICIPIKKNYYVLMLEEIMTGVSTKKIVEKYGWMKSRDGFSDFYTEQDIEEIRKNYKVPAKHEVDIPKELEDLAEELKELNYFRTDRTDKFYEFAGVARPLFEEIAKHVGVSLKELADYDVNSIIIEKPKRYDKNFSYGQIGNKYLISNTFIIPDLNKHTREEVKGRVAYKGKVKGIVRIVTHSDDLNKVQIGDILVAQMTFPSFISAMQKSAAFVTDEGSIACHAAIIAREMKKPCIIGTKNATKILKDGDMVEVDAEKGVVKVIK